MQTSQKQYADRQRRDHSVAVGDQVLLDTRNLNLSHLPSKIRPHFYGPFLVEAQVTPVTFRLRLPDTWKLHNAFHIQLLKPYKDPNQHASGMGLVLGGWARVVLTGHAHASWVGDLASQRSSQGYTFSLGSFSVSWQSTRSSSVLSPSCEAEIYAGAMAAQELRWLTYLLTDLGEAPRSPLVLYVDKKAMLALCQEHRLEHRTKHIAMCYFLA
ncbi:unnamed protein product [Closterium sp. NIES-53]